MYNSYQTLAQSVPDYSLPAVDRTTLETEIDGLTVTGKYTEYQVYGKVIFTARYSECEGLFYDVEIKDRSGLFAYGPEGEEWPLANENEVYDYRMADMIEYFQECLTVDEVA